MIYYKSVTIASLSLLLTILTGFIIWASIESNVIIGFREVSATRWGIATLVDIYISLTFIGVWIGVIEKSLKKGIIWTLSLRVLLDGHPKSQIYWRFNPGSTR